MCKKGNNNIEVISACQHVSSLYLQKGFWRNLLLDGSEIDESSKKTAHSTEEK
jgi:hypothetical protein